MLHHTLGKAGQLDFELECFRPVTCYQVGGWLCVAVSLGLRTAIGATRTLRQRQQSATNTLGGMASSVLPTMSMLASALVGTPGSAPRVDPTNEPFLQAQLRLVDTPAEMVRKLYLALRVSSGCLGSNARMSSHNAICPHAICLNAEPQQMAVTAQSDGMRHFEKQARVPLGSIVQAAVEQRKPVYISIPSDFAAMQARQAAIGKNARQAAARTAATQCNAGDHRHSCMHRPFHHRSPLSPPRRAACCLRPGGAATAARAGVNTQ